jgi:hypothetical protein
MVSDGFSGQEHVDPEGDTRETGRDGLREAANDQRPPFREFTRYIRGQPPAPYPETLRLLDTSSDEIQIDAE